jgi:hypothetical protein
MSNARNEYRFPFSPYPEQTLLMDGVFDTLVGGRQTVSICESPTGTGKSLSLICASLHWLLDWHPNHPDPEEGSGSDSRGGGEGKGPVETLTGLDWLDNYAEDKKEQVGDEEMTGAKGRT